MHFSLVPYSYYILYFSIACVVIYLVILLRKSISLLKTLGSLQGNITGIQNKIQLSQIKIEAVQEKRAKDAKYDKYIKLALPVLLAVYEQYKKDDSLKGVQGARTAFGRTMDNRKAEKALIKKIKAGM